MNRLLRWFLTNDPTTACTWDQVEVAAENVVLRGQLADARRDLKSANAEADLLAKTVRESAADIVKLDQENMTLHLRLTEAEIAAGVVHQIPPLRLFKGGAE